MSVADTTFAEPDSLAVEDYSVLTSQNRRNPVTEPASSGGIALRAECVSPTDQVSKSWQQITDRFETYVASRSDAHPVFRNDQGETFTGSSSHRFSADYAGRKYRKVLQGERDLLREYEDPHTVLLTLTAPVRDTDGRAHRPIDRHLAIKEAYRPVRRKLRYELTNKRSIPFEYVKIHGPTRRGKALGNDHIHLAVYTDGEISAEALHPVIDTYVDKCQPATAEVHPYDQAITVEEATRCDQTPYEIEHDLEPGTPLGKYVMGHMPGLGTDVDVREKSVQFRRHSAMMWATGSQSFTMSQGFPSPEDTQGSGEWEHVGVQIDGETYETEPGPTQPDMIETSAPSEDPSVLTSQNPEPPV